MSDPAQALGGAWETHIAEFVSEDAAYDDVFNYMVSHPDMINGVMHACDLAREKFRDATDAVLSLEVHTPGDGSPAYLALAVGEYPPRENLDAIVEEINRAVFPELDGSAGIFDVVSIVYQPLDESDDSGVLSDESADDSPDDFVLREVDDGHAVAASGDDDYDAVLIVRGSPAYWRIVTRLADVRHQEWVRWTQDLAMREKLSPQTRAQWAQLWCPWGDAPEEVRVGDAQWAQLVFDYLVRPPQPPVSEGSPDTPLDPAPGDTEGDTPPPA